jgi:hypothetical protein
MLLRGRCRLSSRGILNARLLMPDDDFACVCIGTDCDRTPCRGSLTGHSHGGIIALVGSKQPDSRINGSFLPVV